MYSMYDADVFHCGSFRVRGRAPYYIYGLNIKNRKVQYSNKVTIKKGNTVDLIISG